MKGIDHLVLCGSDLSRMRDGYADLGFTLTPVAQHPFGTQNSLVQLDGCFLELLSLADVDLIPEHRPGHFSFAAFNRIFLEEGEGFSMLVLDSEDARGDVAFYRRNGLHTYEVFDFSRKAKLPAGEDATVGFSLAFVSSPQMPRAGFFCCEQRSPEYFWQPRYQMHPNGATAILEVALVAERPADVKPFVELFSGLTAEPRDQGFRIVTARGDISILKPDAFEEDYGIASPVLDRGPRFAGYTVGLKTPCSRPDLLAQTRNMFGTAIRFKTVPVAAGKEDR